VFGGSRGEVAAGKLKHFVTDALNFECKEIRKMKKIIYEFAVQK